MGLKVNLHNVLFLDVECVPQQGSFFDLDDGLKALWEKKSEKLAAGIGLPDATPDELYDNRSGIYAERGKIIVISVGYFAKGTDGSRSFRVKSFSGDNETALLNEFFDLLNTHYDKSFHQLCGHNVKDFDVPYICRRAMVLGLHIPSILDSAGKKPREVNHLDTMDLRRCGDRRTFISLDMLCRTMGVETPKDDISGEQVARVYRDEQDIPRIQKYCEKDVVATAKILLKFLKREDDMPEVSVS